MIYIILILWCASAISIFPNIAPFCQELKWYDKVAVFVITVVGAPFMLIVQALEILLANYLGEGWDSDDEDKFTH